MVSDLKHFYFIKKNEVIFQNKDLKKIKFGLINNKKNIEKKIKANGSKKSDFKDFFGKKYKYFSYSVEKKLSVEDSEFFKEFNLLGINFYILKNVQNKIRFIYCTTKEYPEKSQIYGAKLNFIHIGSMHKQININFKKNKFGLLDIIYTYENNVKYRFNLESCLIKEIINLNDETSELKKVYISKKKVQQNRICFDDLGWVKKELKHLDLKNISQKIIKFILNGASLDSRTEKILKTQFFTLEQKTDRLTGESIKYQMFNSHTILLTQPKTFKSSILATLGTPANDTSDAGLYGYYNVTSDSWVSGAVSKGKDSILIDELNETINAKLKRGETILNNINTPLENGSYSYMKAGNQFVEFGNQFIFMGNVSETFTFEDFLNGLGGNTSALGRRFCYIVYDDKLHAINGKYRNIDKLYKLIMPIKEYLSDILLFFLKNKSFYDKKIKNNKSIQDLINFNKEKLKNLCRDIEHPKSKEFFKEFVKDSIETKLPIMALKLTIFKNLELFLNLDNLNEFTYHNNNFMEDFKKEFENLIFDTETSIKNVIEHLINCEISDTTKKLDLIKINKTLTEKQKLLFFRIAENLKPNQTKIKYDDFKIKGILKKLKQNILNRKSDKRDRKLNYFGIYIVVNKNELEFQINKPIFYKYLESVQELRDEVFSHFGEKPLYDYPENEKQITKKEIIKEENNLKKMQELKKKFDEETKKESLEIDCQDIKIDDLLDIDE